MGKIPVNTQPEALCKYVAENMSVNVILTCNSITKTRKNAIVEYLVYQIPVTQLKGPKG